MSGNSPIAANELYYLALIQRYLMGEVSAEELCSKLMQQWREDRDALERARECLPGRPDLALAARFERVELTKEEFESEWSALLGYSEHRRVHELVDTAFTLCDCYTAEPLSPFDLDGPGLTAELSALLGSCLSGEGSG